MMPDMSGFEVAQHLKSNPNTADIPIIFPVSYTHLDVYKRQLQINDIYQKFASVLSFVEIVSRDGIFHGLTLYDGCLLYTSAYRIGRTDYVCGRREGESL